MKTNRYVLVASLLVGALALGMAPAGAAAEGTYVAPKDMAYIVFVKAGRSSRKAAFLFYDEKVNCVSYMEGGVGAEIIPMKPGKHTIYTVGTNAHRMEFHVEAGRTYFTRISMPRYGYGTIKLVPAMRDTETFAMAKDWVSSAKASDPNEDACRGHKLEGRKEGRNRAENKIPDADNKWKDAEYRKKLTLKKKDGYTAAEAGKL